LVVVGRRWSDLHKISEKSEEKQEHNLDAIEYGEREEIFNSREVLEMKGK
jgi:hypothetical protein